MRIDKFISQQLGISRALAGRELRAKRVTVDGKAVSNGAFKLLPEHQVMYNGELLQQQHGPRYFMLNKPQGYVCSADDHPHPSLFSFIDEPAAHKLHIAGRLDADTTGLVLLTDDGQWSHLITSPRHYCEKAYLVTLEQPLPETVAAQFAAGIQLHGEKTLTRPARLENISDRQVRLTLSEGRYHQVKRMFAAVGNHVVALHRERIGNIVLDNQLAAGEYRPLSDAEASSVTLPQSKTAKTDT